jgi:hypothetical protein
MAQLSTDTLLYNQIITKVQDFLVKHYKDQNTEDLDFDEEYKKLLSDIEKTIGKPMAEMPILQKGEIPSSEKFNKFSKNISNDINTMVHQLDALVSNYVNVFNQISNEIESEKSFVSRIKSKISALEIYSKSSARNITYLGDNFNNLDFVDTSKIRNGYMPDVTDGFACLPRLSSKKASANIALANQSFNNQENRQVSYIDVSNGLKGSNHLFVQDPENQNPFLFQRDNTLIRSNELAMLDETPATYFEYEALNVLGHAQKPEYEFQYSLSNSDNNQSYVSWANFDISKPLKMTVELSLRAKDGEYINYISIVPFFGYDGIDNIKNIKISSVKFFDEKQNIITPLIDSTNAFYVGSDIVAPNLSVKKRYFYNKGVLRFERIKANKVYITFEQESFNDVTIKHCYWKPFETRELANTNNTASSWRGQERFTPSAIVAESANYRVEDVSWNKKNIIPFIERPSEIKSSTNQISQIRLKYWQQSEKTFSRIKFMNDGQVYYLSSDRVNSDGIKLRSFTETRSAATKYNTNSSFLTTIKSTLAQETDYLYIVLPENQDVNSYINSLKKSITSFQAGSGSATFTTSSNNGLQAGDKVYINASRDTDLINKGQYTIVSATSSSFTVSISSGSAPLQNVSNSYYIKQPFSIAENEIEIENFQDSADSQITKELFLTRNFEYLKAKRASIGIRDLFVGIEKYSDVAEIVSKPYNIYGKLDLVSLQVEEFIPTETNDSGEVVGTSSIDYYISVDGGSKWIAISPLERPFQGKPEIVAFNQNLSNSQQLPQIAYFNAPEVPEEISSVVLKAVMKKDRNVAATPIIYSYKIGLKVS